MSPGKFFVLAVAALVLGLSVAACDSGPSDADVKLAELEAAKEARQMERLKQRVRAAEKLNRERGRAVGTPAVQSSGGEGEAIPQYREDCGSGIYASGSASCGFAQNIAGAYRAAPSATLYDIYSPATGLEYTVSCQEGSFVTCTGGRAAVVYFYR